MLFNGEHFRRISERDNYAFNATLSLDNTTGVGLFGFSGNGQQFKFDFQSGKIIDPESNYVSSYAPDKPFILSGDVNKNSYNYYIDDIPVRFSGQKTDFKAQRFFTNSSGCSVDLNVVMTASGLDAISVTGFPDNFEEGDLITGKIVNTGSGASIDIYTGEINDPNLTGNFSVFSLPSTISGEGDIVLSGISGDNGVQYDLTFDFDTSFGRTSAASQVSGFGYFKWAEFELAKSNLEAFEITPTGSGLNQLFQPPVLISGGNYNAQKTGVLQGTVISGSGNYVLPGSKVHASLEYISGTTGQFSGMITGINLISGGSGYINDPILSIDGGGGANAEVSGFLSGGIVTGFEILNVGAGYTSVPTLNAFKSIAIVDVVDEGTGYLTAPRFTFSGGGGSGATAEGVVENGFLKDINIINQGSGYTGTPELIMDAVNVSGVDVSSSGDNYNSGTVIFEGGTGASHVSASADPLFGFKVTGVNVVSGGLGYNYEPESIYQFQGGTPLDESNLASGEARFNWMVTGVDLSNVGLINVGGVRYTNIEVNFNGGTGVNGVAASGVPVIDESGGIITGYTSIDDGSNYKLARLATYETPGVVITGSGLGEYASGYAVVTGYKVSGVEIRYTGGFTLAGANEPDHVHFSGGLGPGGIHASGTLLTGDNISQPGGDYIYPITGVNMVSGGFNYTGYPTITFRKSDGSLVTNPPSGSGVLISGAISGINFTNSGVKYSSGLPVSFTGGAPDRSGSGIVLTNYPFNSMTGVMGVRMISAGSGYTGVPTVAFGYSAAPDGTISTAPVGTAGLGSGYITGVHIYNVGGFYEDPPVFVVSPSGDRGDSNYNPNLYVADDFVEPELVVMTGSGTLTGFNLTSGGSGYTGIPTVTVSGDGTNASGVARLATGARGELTMAEGIVGVPIIGNYTKTFENTFNLFTGSGNSESGTIYYDFSGNGAINTAKTKYSSDIITFTGDQSVIDIRVTNNNYFDDSFIVSQLNLSGNGQSTGIRITGVR